MMKKLLFSAVFVAGSLLSFGQSTCTDPVGLIVPDITVQTLTSNGGYYEFNATTGCTYNFSHCMNGGSYTGDTYLTITDLTNTTIAANDDVCGLGSQLFWTSTVTGLVRIHLGECCGGTGVCGGGPTRVLAYWTDCAPCTGAAPVSVSPVAPQCTSGSFTLNATSTDQLSWFDVPNTSGVPVQVGPTYVTPVIMTTTTYYVAAYDAVNMCFGPPVAVTAEIDNPLTIAYNSNTVFCDNNEPVALPFYPSGGTLTGPGTSGAMFDPSVGGAGTYWIYYNAGDACNSNDSVEIDVLTAAIDPPMYACEGDIVQVNGNATGTTAWFGGQLSNTVLDTGDVIDWVLTNTTTLYYGETPPTFYVDTITVSNFLVSDHDAVTNDDRGGIAITPNYLYVVGDGTTGRIDADLVGPWTSLPIRDGIFSDLNSGQLYTLWNGSAAPAGTWLGGDYILSSICPMDADLNINTAGEIFLSQTITLSNSGGNVGMFAGKGELIIWTSNDNTFWLIEIATGNVTNLGTGALAAFNSENWAFWGVAEAYNGHPSVTYRTNMGDQIVRYNIFTTATEIVADFPGGLSDMANITVSPWNNRLYFHYESGSGTFGGSFETAGYTDAVLVSSAGGGGGCRTAVDLIVSAPTPDLGQDTTICSNAPYLLNPGAGFGSYLWSNSATTQTISVATAGSYSVEVTDSLGCVNSDTIEVATVDELPVSLGTDISLCDYQVVVLNAGGGYNSYSWSNGETNQILYVETDTLSVGANTFTVTTTDANGCFSTDDIDIIVIDCAGIGEVTVGSVIMYPNPVRDNLVIDLNNVPVSSLRIVDISGKFVTALVPTSSIVTLDMSGIADGLYLVEVIGENNQIQQMVKITVSH